MMPLALGASDGLAMFARVLTRPEPGYYKIQAGIGAKGVLEFAGADRFNVLNADYDFTVATGSGEGRYLHNDYDYSKGYFWSSYQTQVGSFYEKLGSIYYLMEAYNHFVQNDKGDYIDGRYKNLNYSSIYPQQIRRLFASLMQDDKLLLGPYVAKPATATQAARVNYLPWEKYSDADSATTAPAYAKGSVVLDPLVGWEQQYPALIYGLYFGRTTMTMDWVNQMRIFSPDGVEAVSIDPSELVKYRDPSSGIIYVARNYGTEIVNGKTVYRSSGARMLQYANDVAKAAFKVKPGSEDPISGMVEFERDANNEPICTVEGTACNEARAKVKNYSANLDIVREFTHLFGNGPL
jgi:hypothetical protein